MAAIATLSSLSAIPLFAILDAEGFVVPSTQQQWFDLIHGWANAFAGTNLTPAFYTSQSPYATFNLGATGVPAFVAVSPILNNTPSVGGVQGYAAYYGTCPAGAETTQVADWGGFYSTIQFGSSSGTQFPTCGPS